MKRQLKTEHLEIFHENRQFSLRRAAMRGTVSRNVPRRLEIWYCSLPHVWLHVDTALGDPMVGTSAALVHVVRAVSLPSVPLARLAASRRLAAGARRCT